MSSDTAETNERFRQRLKLPFPLVGDPGGAIAKAYGVRIAILGLAKRATFVVGPDHRVKSALLDNFDPEAHVRGACAVIVGKGE